MEAPGPAGRAGYGGGIGAAIRKLERESPDCWRDDRHPDNIAVLLVIFERRWERSWLNYGEAGGDAARDFTFRAEEMTNHIERFRIARSQTATSRSLQK